MKYSIIAFPVTPCLMHVLAGKFAWRNEKIFQYCDLTTAKKSRRKIMKTLTMLGINAPAGKIPESQFFFTRPEQ